MASAQSKILNIVLRLINKKGLLKRQFAKGRFDDFISPTPPKKILRTCAIDTNQINGHNVFTLIPKHNISKKHILYLHGGAYVTSFVSPHWYFLELISAKTQCVITSPDYPLAPKHTYKEVFEMIVKLYQKLLLTVHSSDIILMGDSAGGGLALALTQRLKVENLPLPCHTILLSPWLDVTLSNPEIPMIDRIDPFTGIEGLRLAGKVYAGDSDPTHYLLSPINGPLKGLGKISIFAGTKDILVADSRKLKSLAESQGATIDYYEYKDMIHAWMLLYLPESKKAKNEIAELIKSS